MKIEGILGRIGDHQRLRIGQADIFDRHPHHPPAPKQRVLAGIQHALRNNTAPHPDRSRAPIYARRDQVVMAVGGFVVDRRSPLQDVLQLHGVEDLAGPRGAPDFLGQCQRCPAVAVGHPHQHSARLRIERQFSAFDYLGMGEQFFDRRRIERMKHQHTGARQQKRR